MESQDRSVSTAWQGEAQAALDAYDYDLARELLARAVERSGGGLEPAQRLLELLVDVLCLDVEALALAARLSRATQRDALVRCRLALAAARLGQTKSALDWLEGQEAAEAVAALIVCAQAELTRGQLDACQALLQRARRLDPLEPRLAAVEQALRDERRFHALMLEEELDVLLGTPGSADAAEALARTLLARDKRNAKAARVVEQAELARAEAAAQALLESVEANPPSTEPGRQLLMQRLRAAAVASLGDALRQQLTSAAQALVAGAGEARNQAALEQLVRASGAGDSTAELVARYTTLPDALRRRARELTGEPLFVWADELGLGPEPPRTVTRALDALRKASALQQRDPETALAVLEADLEPLRRLAHATELRTALVERLAHARREVAVEALDRAEEALNDGAAQRAIELLAKLPCAKLDDELVRRAHEITTRAERTLTGTRLERALQAHREQGRPIEARVALEELIASGLLAAEPPQRVEELRRGIEADIERTFAVTRLPGPLGDWWRGLVSRSEPKARTSSWLCPSSGHGVVPIQAGRWLLLVRLSLATGRAQGALLVRLPRRVSDLTDARLQGTELTLLSDGAELLSIDIVTGHVASWEEAQVDPDRLVDDCWLSRDPRRLWIELRRRGKDSAEQQLRLVERRSGRLVAELERGERATVVRGHPKADVILQRRGRAVLADAAGRPLPGKLPNDCSCGVVHPRGNGTVVCRVDHEDTGVLTLHELVDGQRARSTEVGDMSGEAQHTIGVSRDAAIVAALGYVDSRELWVFRAKADGLELAWRRECGPGPLLLGDADCAALYLLHAKPHSEAGWLSRLDEHAIEIDALPDDDDGRVPLDGFELWRCTVPGEEPLPARRASAGGRPGPALDAFVARSPSDYGGLRRLWSRLEGSLDEGPARDAELERLVQAHPSSPAVRLLVAHMRAAGRRWDDTRTCLKGIGPDDVEPKGARHLCHLQALSCLRAGEEGEARSWIERGLQHEGSCVLQDLQLALEPLHEAPELHAPAPPSEPTVATTERSAIVELRRLLRELDRSLADDAARVLEHATLNLVGSRSPQVLARQATAWLAVNADGLEANARRTLELARFCEAFDFIDSAERELFLPEAWPVEQLFALRERAMREIGEQGGIGER